MAIFNDDPGNKALTGTRVPDMSVGAFQTTVPWPERSAAPALQAARWVPAWCISMLSTAALLMLNLLFGAAPAAAQEVRWNSVVGIFSATEPVRLGIGPVAVKQVVPASHESWATRLVLKRLDGPSSGPVSAGHLIGIFSEDGKYRLDIGTGAMKQNIPASHESWATRLKIMRLNGAGVGSVSYGEVVGIFSEDGRFRLDIGTDAMKQNTPASHESWATRLQVRPLQSDEGAGTAATMPVASPPPVVMAGAGPTTGLPARDRIRSSGDPSRCLHKQGDDFNNGNIIHIWDCDAGPEGNKAFYYDSATGYIRSSLQPSKCLHKQSDGWRFYDTVHLWDCAAGSTANKTFDYQGPTGQLRFRENPSFCALSRQQGFASGNPIVVGPCGSAETYALRVSGPADELVGQYENRRYDQGGKNDWHYATVTKVSDNVLRWTNRANVSWTLTLSPDRNVLLVGSENPYSSQGYRTARVVWAGSSVAAIHGPGDEPYERDGARARLAAERQQRAVEQQQRVAQEQQQRIAQEQQQRQEAERRAAAEQESAARARRQQESRRSPVLDANRSQPYKVTFFNQGGYVARFMFSYRGGPSETFSIPVGQSRSFSVPFNAEDLVMRGDASGLSWIKIFHYGPGGDGERPQWTYNVNADYRVEGICIKTWGTLFGVAHGKC